MKTSSMYRAEAREKLTNLWAEAAVISVVFLAVAAFCSGLNVFSTFSDSEWLHGSTSSVSTLLNIVIYIPLAYAYEMLFLRFVRGNDDLTLEGLLAPIRSDYSRLLCTGLIISLLVGIASIFTFGILGIYLGLAYSQVPFLLNDYPELTWREAMKTSREMMNGHKWDLFVLQFSFIGWILLSFVTCGLGFILLAPYMQAAEALFYEDLKSEMIIDENQIEDAQVIE